MHLLPLHVAGFAAVISSEARRNLVSLPSRENFVTVVTGHIIPSVLVDTPALAVLPGSVGHADNFTTISKLRELHPDTIIRAGVGDFIGRIFVSSNDLSGRYVRVLRNKLNNLISRRSCQKNHLGQYCWRIGRSSYISGSGPSSR